jgi:hypothetical protein
MNKHLRSHILLIPLALLISACIFTLPKIGTGGSSQNNPDLLTDPINGLSSLQSYHVSFQQDVTGLEDGKPFERHTSLELTRTGGQVDFSRQIQGTDEIASYFHAVQTGTAAYRWDSQDESCQGEAGALLQGEVLEPAHLLLAVSKTTKVGSETVNDIPAIHYHFDEGGLALTSPKPSVSGDFWLAADEGYVVKYTLNAPAPSTTTGKGMEVGQTMTYELTRVNAVASIDLPAGCMAVPVDLPVMPGATEVSRRSGNVSYTTASSLAQVIDLYYKDLGSLGWAAPQAEPTGDLKLPFGLSFQQGDLRLSIDIDEGTAGGLDVDLVVYNPGEQTASPAPTPVATVTPSGPLPTVNPAESGLPTDVPLYPGATDLKKLPNTGVKFSTSDPPDVVAKFYRDRLKTFKWTLQNEMKPAADKVVQNWMKSGRMLVVMIQVENGTTTVMLMLTGQP